MFPSGLGRLAACVALAASVAATTLWTTSAPRASAQEATAWSQFQGDAAHSGSAMGPEPPYRVRWSLPAPAGTSLSGAVISDGVAYAVGQEAVYAIELDSGAVAWEAPRAGGPIGVPAITGGPRASLLFVDGPAPGQAAAASPTPAPGATPDASPSPEAAADEPAVALVSLDPADGSERWRVPLEAPSRTGVTLAGGAAYVGDTSGTVTSVSVADGEVRWSVDAGARTDVPIAVGDGVAVVLARDENAREVTVSAFDEEDGSSAWDPITYRIGSSASSAPAVADGIVFLGMADRFVRALGEGGQERWSALVLSVFSPATSAAVADGTVYLADVGGGLYALDAETGVRRWTYQFNELVLRSSPTRTGETVLLGLNGGRLVALDAGSGHLVWESEASPGLLGTIAVGPDVLVATKGGADAGLVAFEHDPGGALVDVPSPTEIDAGTTLPRVGLAAAITLAVALVPGLLARRRFGDAFGSRDSDEEWDDEDTEDAS